MAACVVVLYCDLIVSSCRRRLSAVLDGKDIIIIVCLFCAFDCILRFAFCCFVLWDGRPSHTTALLCVASQGNALHPPIRGKLQAVVFLLL